ncbi:MAG: hypothetical protein JWP55_4884, partial [Mycobacterium sp.]|nr:hypothetical protein [Mycobacterium sp.]
ADIEAIAATLDRYALRWGIKKRQ